MPKASLEDAIDNAKEINNRRENFKEWLELRNENNSTQASENIFR